MLFKKLSYKDSRDCKRSPAFFVFTKIQSGLFALYNKNQEANIVPHIKQYCNVKKELQYNKVPGSKFASRPNGRGLRPPERLRVQAGRTIRV